MDQPDEKGTYILIACVAQMKRIEVGQLGTFDIVPGFYAYVGSAFGGGGLRARLGHHLEPTTAPHWHIDYLLAIAQPVEVWYTTVGRRLEHRWADLMIITAADRATCFTPGGAPPSPGFNNGLWNELRTSTRNVA